MISYKIFTLHLLYVLRNVLQCSDIFHTHWFMSAATPSKYSHPGSSLKYAITLKPTETSWHHFPQHWIPLSAFFLSVLSLNFYPYSPLTRLNTISSCTCSYIMGWFSDTYHEDNDYMKYDCYSLPVQHTEFSVYVDPHHCNHAIHFFHLCEMVVTRQSRSNKHLDLRSISSDVQDNTVYCIYIHPLLLFSIL